jgi:MSV199 domain/Protein of unknown function (DUF3627)/Centromere-associated protein K
MSNTTISTTTSLSTTSFLGVTIDAEKGCSDPRIKKALDKSFKLLDIMEFINVTKFKLNMAMFDYFWQVVVGNTGTLVGTRILEWFGYDGEYKKQRQNFKKMLNNNAIEYRELTQHDKEIELYSSIKDEISLLPSNVTNSKFLIMEPDDLKMAIMQLKTKNGHIIRQYYIDLEKLLKLYTEYTLYFNHRESQRKITNLEQMMADMKLTNSRLEESNQRQEQIMNQQTQYMKSLGISLEEVKDQNEELKDQNDELLGETKNLKQQNNKIQRKLGIAVEDRAPLPVDQKKQERFVLLKRNDPDYMPYYTIRAQSDYTTRKLRSQKMLFPTLEILLDFKANPNSKTLYVRIKDELKAKGVSFDGNNIDLNEIITELELIDEMKVINDQKYNV